MKNIPTQSLTTDLSPTDFNQIPDEMENKITSADIVLSGADLNQEGKATANYVAASSFYGCTNIGDDYTITPTSPFQGITKYIDGVEVRFRPSITNTTQSPTINVNSKGVKDIVRSDGATQIAVAEINAGSDITLRYDLSNDIFIIPEISSAEGIVLGSVDGFLPSNATDTNNDLTFQSGISKFSDDTFAEMTTAITKQKDTNFVEGDNAGGKASGATFVADITLYCFFMTDSINSKADIGYDTSSTAVNLQADANVIAGNFTKFVEIYSSPLNGSANFPLITAFLEGGGSDIVTYFTSEITWLTASASSETAPVPLGRDVKLRISMSSVQPNEENSTIFDEFNNRTSSSAKAGAGNTGTSVFLKNNGNITFTEGGSATVFINAYKTIR